MTGLELSRSYCEFYAPSLFEGLPSDVRYRAALGLVGEGSECLGFDDEISRDHDFGPGFCVWLPTNVYEEWGSELQRRYDLLPVSFKGFTRQQTQMAGKRVGVFEMQAFYRLYTGLSRAPQCAKEWLAIPEQLLVSDRRIRQMAEEGIIVRVASSPLCAWCTRDFIQMRLCARSSPPTAHPWRRRGSITFHAVLRARTPSLPARHAVSF